MGIPAQATVAFAKSNRRKRRHRIVIYNLIKDKIEKVIIREDKDIPLQRVLNEKYRKDFSTKITKNLVRTSHPTKEWYKGIWFTHAMLKYSFFTWLAINNRLSMGDRMRTWNSDQRVDCILCGHMIQSRSHLFFIC